MRLPIRETLADNASDGALSALAIIYANSDPVAIAEVKLCEITVQMFLGTVLIGAFRAALENREVVFNGVGRCVSTDVFASRVLDGFVFRKIQSDAKGAFPHRSSSGFRAQCS
jgi:hypothetical protein